MGRLVHHFDHGTCCGDVKWSTWWKKVDRHHPNDDSQRLKLWLSPLSHFGSQIDVHQPSHNKNLQFVDENWRNGDVQEFTGVLGRVGGYLFKLPSTPVSSWYRWWYPWWYQWVESSSISLHRYSNVGITMSLTTHDWEYLGVVYIKYLWWWLGDGLLLLYPHYYKSGAPLVGKALQATEYHDRGYTSQCVTHKKSCGLA